MTAPFFVDSLAPMTEAAVDFLLCKSGGVLPLAWGRYLDADLTHDIETAAAHGIPLLLIARRSSRVCMGREAGTHDGAEDRATAEHWIALAASKGASVLRSVFLDVEQEPDLTSDYWHAWSAAFDGAEVVPCIYAPNRNWWPASWAALESAVAAGARCGGAWVAMYHQAVDGSAVLRDESWLGRPRASERVPFLAWQHTGNAYQQRYDFSAPNPNAMDWLADTLPRAPDTLRSPEPPRAAADDPAPLATAAQGGST